MQILLAGMVLLLAAAGSTDLGLGLGLRAPCACMEPARAHLNYLQLLVHAGRGPGIFGNAMIFKGLAQGTALLWFQDAI